LYFPKRTQIFFPIPFILEIYLNRNKLTARSSSLVQNTLRDGDEFNWILTHKDTEDIKESWFQPGDMEEVRRIIEDCDPRIAAAVKKTKECLDWKICYRDPIPSWVSRSHKIALLGDSCHPHLPTSAQGASQATESAAVLALCLKLAGKENIPLAVSYSENNGR
jgi:salicylate hydroxylase